MTKTISTLALVFAASAFTTFAQETAAPAKNNAKAGREGKNPLVLALDTNKDGVIDASEIANAPAALKTLDKNGDGQLTRDEYRAARPEGAEKPAGKKEGKGGKGDKGAKKERQPLLAALDANGDGVIDAKEIANAPAALKTLDKNGDGKLTRDEYHRANAEGAGPEGTKDSEPKKHGKKKGSDAPAPTPASTPTAS